MHSIQWPFKAEKQDACCYGHNQISFTSCRIRIKLKCSFFGYLQLNTLFALTSHLFVGHLPWTWFIDNNEWRVWLLHCLCASSGWLYVR